MTSNIVNLRGLLVANIFSCTRAVQLYWDTQAVAEGAFIVTTRSPIPKPGHRRVGEPAPENVPLEFANPFDGKKYVDESFIEPVVILALQGRGDLTASCCW